MASPFLETNPLPTPPPIKPITPSHFISTSKTKTKNIHSEYKESLIHQSQLGIMASPSSTHQNPSTSFHDFLPVMANKLGGEGLIEELCNGFNLLMDGDKGVITFASLKKNSSLLGLQDLSDDDLRSMLNEGDIDGDGVLNQNEFCVLMFRLSPELMEASHWFLEEAIQQDLDQYFC